MSNYENFINTLTVLDLDGLDKHVIREAAFKLASEEFNRGFSSASDIAFKTIEAIR